MDALNDFILLAAASPWLYCVMFVLALVDGFFPPVPSETVLVAAAAVAVSAGTNTLILCLVAALGAMIGDNIAYAIGRSVGLRRFPWMRRPRVVTSVQWAQRALECNGAGLILVGRFIPVGRVAVNMCAGAVGYPWRRFLALSAVGAVGWSTFSVVVGLLAGQWLKDQPMLSALIGIVLALVVGVVIDRVLAVRGRRARAAVVPRDDSRVARAVPRDDADDERLPVESWVEREECS